MTEPIRLTPNIYLIGSGEIGLSEEHDSHVYLVKTGTTWVLFDAGAGIQTEPLLYHTQQVIPQGQSFSHLFLTHCHADHAGGAASLQSKYRLQVVTGQLSMERVKQADEPAMALDVARLEGIYPPDYVFTPLKEVVSYPDNAQLRFGQTTITLIETPGHSADSVCYLTELPEGIALFCGDTLFASGLLPLLNTPDSDLGAYRKTIQRLSTMPFEILCPGHGLFILKKAHELAKQLADKLNRSIYIPPIITPS